MNVAQVIVQISKISSNDDKRNLKDLLYIVIIAVTDRETTYITQRIPSLGYSPSCQESPSHLVLFTCNKI